MMAVPQAEICSCEAWSLAVMSLFLDKLLRRRLLKARDL